MFALHGVLYAQTVPAGSITALQGKVSIERAGSPAIMGRANQAVQIGDRIITGPNSRVTITLSDGTQLGLSESSTLMVADNRLDASGYRARTEIDLFSGLVHSMVRHAPGNAPNYEVHTPNAVAAARGTDYDTAYIEGEKRNGHDGCLKFTDVTVYDGVVEVWNNSTPGNSLKLRKGRKTTVPCGLLPDPPAQPYLAEGVLGTALAGGGIITGVGVGGVFGGSGGGGSDPPPQRPPVTASQ